MTHDTNGREYAKLSQTRGGTFVEIGPGFDDLPPGRTLVYRQGPLRWVCGPSGRHYLEDFLGNHGDHLIGIYPIPIEEPSQ